MVFEVIGFGIIIIVLFIIFVRYFVSNWFLYFMVGLVVFEVGMFIMIKGKIIELERVLKWSEKFDGNNRDLFILSVVNKV